MQNMVAAAQQGCGEQMGEFVTSRAILVPSTRQLRA